MRGYIIHLDPNWCGLRHALIVARNEYDLLQQLYNYGMASKSKVAEKHRITACLESDEDWKRFQRCSFSELCSECDHGRTAA
jgi:hypothetical protein